MAYLDGVLHEAPLPEPVAMELCQGQDLGRSLASLIVACRQLWLSQARVLDVDKAALLDAPISPGHTFGPAMEEISMAGPKIPAGMRGVLADGRVAPSPRFCVRHVEPLASSSDVDCHQNSPSPHGSTG
ncbi:UNVERIFIED_CONTAM: hypothetical protein FKN15_039830 [Acipenser sinensis]